MFTCNRRGPGALDHKGPSFGLRRSPLRYLYKQRLCCNRAKLGVLSIILLHWYTAMLTINRHFAFLWYKMRSLWEGKTYAKNTTSPLNLCYVLKKGLDLSILKNLGSVGQRASKLPAVKVGGHKKKSADWPRPLLNQSAWIRVVPGSNHSQSLMAGHFAALWPTDLKFSALKDLNPFKKL